LDQIGQTLILRRDDNSGLSRIEYGHRKPILNGLNRKPVV
jgi:hypothetical protein